MVDEFNRAATTADAVLESIDIPPVEPSVEGIIYALRMVNEHEACVLNLPVRVWAMIEPAHTAIRTAQGRRQRRAAWRAWGRRVEEVASLLRADVAA
jgi:hypothetical protein